ncbi:transposase [Bacteroides pyogenes]|uniref:transposase n=1 Tax=Bacteroides pyogenes TaxID=310300 RepID=UPI001BA64314
MYANQVGDYRIFEEFAYYLISEDPDKREASVFNIGENVYAFDSTTIDLCLSVFWWTKFRKNKTTIKVHTLYDIETQIPAFIHITNGTIHYSKILKKIPYERGAYCIFDRAYNKFKEFYKITFGWILFR